MSDKELQILLIEDNPGDAALIKYMVSEIEWPTIHLSTVDRLSSALQLIKNQPFDLILLDLMLPDSAGRNTFSQLFATNTHIPIVVLSGLDDRQIALAAIKEGAQDYLVKGEIDTKLLERTIRHAIERSHLLNTQKKIQQDLRAHDQLLQLITNISATFINISSEQIDQAIEQSLRSIAQFLNADKAFFMEISTPQAKIQQAYEWNSSAASMGLSMEHTLNTAGLHWVLQSLHTANSHFFQNLENMPTEAADLRQVLQEQAINSFMMLALFHRKQIIAILGLATVGKSGYWSRETISLLSTSGEVFYRALKKKQAEEAVKESERRYRSLVENMDEGLIYVDAEDKIQFANDSFCRMLGYTPDEVLGKQFINDIFDEGYRHTNILQMMRHQPDSGSIAQYEVLIKTKNGGKLWVIVNKHPLVDDNGVNLGTMSTIVNITDRKRVEEKLKQVNEELKTFIYRASHDLRGPLVTVLGITSLAKMEVTESTALKYFEFIGQSTQKLDKTLKALMDISTIAQPDETYSHIVFEELIHEVIDNLNYTSSLENLSIKLTVEQQGSFISNRQLLIYVFEKLIENAVFFRKENIREPWLRIHVQVTEETAIIDLQDNGIGIPKEMQPKVFHMFFKGIERTAGSGLGLYIVEKLVTNLNGTIGLTSEVNVGTRFTINLKSF